MENVNETRIRKSGSIIMVKIWVGGGDKQYSENYDKIFRKSKKTKIKNFVDKLLFKVFIEEKKK